MTVKVKTIDAQVRGLEEEFKALKTLIKGAAKAKKDGKRFVSLRGIWKNKGHFTMDAIKEAEIKVKGL